MTRLFFSEIRFCLAAAWGGLLGRRQAVAAVPNDWGLAWRSFLAPLLALSWTGFERWMVYHKVYWYTWPDPGLLMGRELIYALQTWVVFPAAIWGLVSVFRCAENFPRFLTVMNWASLFLLPLIIASDLILWLVPDFDSLSLSAQDSFASLSNFLHWVYVLGSGVIAFGFVFLYLRLARVSLGLSWAKAVMICFAAGALAIYADTKIFAAFGLPKEETRTLFIR